MNLGETRGKSSPTMLVYRRKSDGGGVAGADPGLAAQEGPVGGAID